MKETYLKKVGDLRMFLAENKIPNEMELDAFVGFDYNAETNRSTMNIHTSGERQGKLKGFSGTFTINDYRGFE